MKQLFILLISFFVIIAQKNELTVICIKSQNLVNQVQDFEIQFIKTIVNLYNKRTKNNYHVKVKLVNGYKPLFDAIENSKPSDNICSIRSITITEERKKRFDFSKPYMPIKQVLITSADKKEKMKNWQNMKVRMGNNPHTIHNEKTLKLAKKFNFKIVDFTQNGVVDKLLLSDKIDFYVGDISDVWSTKHLVVLDDLEGALFSYYGIMYPKGSALKAAFDPIISYFTKTQKFFHLLKEHLGNDVSAYYQSLYAEKKM